MANNHTAGTAARTFAPSELCQRMLAKTSKGTCGPCILYLEDGTIFYGRACGAEGTATGEVCFNTSLEGYFEVMTDPSYAGHQPGLIRRSATTVSTRPTSSRPSR